MSPEDQSARSGEVRRLGDPRPVTYDQAEAAYRGTSGPRERFEDLVTREMVSRSRAILKARGDFDPAAHGTFEPEALTRDEHLELLALGELLARYYRHPARVHDAVQAGVTWPQIAAATGTAEPSARQAYRDWADRQHALWQDSAGRLGLSDAMYSESMCRAAEPDLEAGQ